MSEFAKLVESAATSTSYERKQSRGDDISEALSKRLDTLMKDKKDVQTDINFNKEQAKRYDKLADYLEKSLQDQSKKTQEEDPERYKVILEELGLPAEFIGLLFKAGKEAVIAAINKFRKKAKEHAKIADELFKKLRPIEKRLDEINEIMKSSSEDTRRMDVESLKYRELVASIIRENSEAMYKQVLEEQEKKA